MASKADIEAILQERNRRHGEYRFNSDTFARLFGTIDLTQWASLSKPEKLAVNVLLLKISRIVNSSKPNLDSWADIAGYALLVLSEFGYEVNTDETRAKHR